MKCAVFAFTERGKRLARKVAAYLGNDCELLAPQRLVEGDFHAYEGTLSRCVGNAFDRDALVFVGAAGIAVRAVAPHVVSKTSDPAVLCMDEAGRYVVPLLSGHIGGANALAERLAMYLGATPVITTATDVNHLFSVDAWATQHHMVITSMELAKRVSAEILTRDIPFWSEGEPPASLAPGLFWCDRGELGVCVSIHDVKPFEETLLLVPRVLRLGIGCRRGVSKDSVEHAICTALSENHMRVESVAEVASIDIKSDEPGLIECCQKHEWPMAFHTADELSKVEGCFAGSDFVRRTVGVDNVCERAATASGGRLVIHKTTANGVTVAAAEMGWRVDFG